jgi:2-polyprenyl-3-methyl-5-hydroxy-6-metoxy-1,4-benzoquinol methylase
MPSALESPNEDLKQASKEWWSSHPQDYVDPGEVDHLGVGDEIGDRELLELLDKFDRNFILDGYFGQRRGGMLFSDLLPQNLSGKKVLEIGCGLGAHTEVLCRLGALVTAIDLAPMSIRITQRRLALKGLNAEVIEADAENLPFSDGHFDYVWSWGVIHHSPNTMQCAHEIARILKPGGGLGIMLYNRNSLYNWINVIFRYGIMQRKLLNMSMQDLHNRYTDGKALTGAPLSKYYTAREIREELFPGFVIYRQTTFEQKRAVSFLVPARCRRRFEQFIPDYLYTRLWSKLGFLVFTEGQKK